MEGGRGRERGEEGRSGEERKGGGEMKSNLQSSTKAIFHK